MNRNIVIVAFFVMIALALIGIPGVLWAQYITGIVISPSNPSEIDTVNIVVYGDFSQTGIDLVDSSLTICEYLIQIDLYFECETISCIGLPILLPYSRFFRVGLLPPGNYRVESQSFFLGQPAHFAQTTFEVLPEEICGNDGDVDDDGNLTPGDALCAFKIFLNNQNLHPDCDVEGFDCEVDASDVNCDDTVTPGDALAIFQRFLDGLPPDRCFAQEGLLAKASVQVAPYQLSLNLRTTLTSGNRLERDVVKVSLKVDKPEGLDAFGLSFMYPADKLEFLGVERTALTADWIQLDGQSNEPGKIIVGGFNDKPLPSTASGELFHLVFASKGLATRPTDFRISDLVDDVKDATVLSEGGDSGDLASIPKEFKLHQNYPNPFNPETRIRFDIPKLTSEEIRVRLSIYNVTGQLVRVLLDEERSAGSYEIRWDGRNAVGVQVPSGMYFYSIRAGDFKDTKKMLLLR